MVAQDHPAPYQHVEHAPAEPPALVERVAGARPDVVAAEVATEVASKAVQVCGAYGTMVNAPFNRFFRDAKTYEIGGGSTEVLRNTLAKYIDKHIVKQAAAS
ncbi:acyl-CoA dehydrogenase family protein [Methylobacterium frigidaeris]|uniref:Acyl-CoA dehydrogenase/oxidase C-terminal domain-containing protein n=1 Tax=Methylobacterium frigidaeris TaxID=2038277 RepID=A0AA37HI92_9HYPH|nr:acyl-CoA dehydrogenase family protein [Methylobacterium frigidaeris]GJD66079.1 hypothetical protein MPEAHAMD_6275 [Methylobacterium frigidaeris]